MKLDHIYEEEAQGVKQIIPDFETFSSDPAKYMAKDEQPAGPEAGAGEAASTEDDVLGAQQQAPAAQPAAEAPAQAPAQPAAQPAAEAPAQAPAAQPAAEGAQAPAATA